MRFYDVLYHKRICELWQLPAAFFGTYLLYITVMRPIAACLIDKWDSAAAIEFRKGVVVKGNVNMVYYYVIYKVAVHSVTRNDVTGNIQAKV